MTATPAAPPQDAPSPAEPPPPSVGTGKALGLFLLATLAGLGLASLVEGPSWRLDVWTVARRGAPRLLGIWTPAGALLWWLLLLPTTVVGFAAALPKGRRGLAAGLFSIWLSTTLALTACDRFLAGREHLLPQSAMPYFPYMAQGMYPFGVRFFQADKELILRHQPNGAMPSPVDYGRDGDLLAAGYVEKPDASWPSELFANIRYFNARGFAKEFGDDPTTPPRVAFVGDSFTFGYSLKAEETWPALLLNHLSRGGDLPTANDPLALGVEFACGNYTPLEGMIALRRAALDPPPKIVVALFYEGNDLSDAARHGELRKEGRTDLSPFEAAKERSRLSILERSPLCALLGWAFAPTDLRLDPSERAEPWKLRTLASEDRRAKLRGVPGLPPEPTAESLTATPEPIAPAIPARRVVLEDGTTLRFAINPFELMDLCRDPGWPRYMPGWPWLARSLDDLAAYQRETGCRVLVALAPTKLRVAWPLMPEEEFAGEQLFKFSAKVAGEGVNSAGDAFMAKIRASGSWLPRLRQSPNGFADALSEECAAREMAFIDLAPGLTEQIRERRDPLYFPFDTHWNPRGHAAAAALIEAKLKELLAEPAPAAAR